MNKSYGVVIQGPLFSRGVTAPTERVPKSELGDEHLTSFDCSDLIIKYVDDLAGTGVPIVLATWKNERIDLRKKLQRYVSSQFEIIEIGEDEYRACYLKPPREGNQKYRQIFSTLVGLTSLHARGCTHFIKLRTDLEIDLQEFISECDLIHKSNPNRIIVPWFSPGSPDNFVDFFFCAPVTQAKRFFSHYLQSDEVFNSIHTEIFYRWPIFEIGFRLPRIGYKCLRKLSLYRWYVWKYFLSPASFKVFRGLKWRGVEMFEENVDSIEGINRVFADNFSDSIIFSKSKLRF